MKRHVPKFVWGKEQQDAFQSLKVALTSAPVLRIPDQSNPFRIITDASQVALGGILTQKHANRWLPCAYLSHKFSQAELKYSSYEKELLAVYYAVKHWRQQSV